MRTENAGRNDADARAQSGPAGSTASKVVAHYRERFRCEPSFLAVTPGRVNLIGDHTDYNGGWALPFALDRSIAMAAGPSPDRSVLAALDRGEETDFDPSALPMPRPGHWSNYPIGVAAAFRDAGREPPPFRACFAGDIPPGGGLSSSAALANCTALILDRLAGSGLPREELALLSQAAEHRYAGARVGILDQYATLLCRRGHGMLLDCRTRAYRHVPLPLGPYRFVLCNSMVKHDLATSGYNDRRRECESALAKLRRRFPALPDLRECDGERLRAARMDLTEAEYKRVRHQVGENRRVLDAESALLDGDMQRLGRLMAESHESLSRDYEVSSPEQDFLVREALARDGVPGARMTGGGFGGNVICLVHGEGIAEFASGMRGAFSGRFGIEPDILPCSPGPGAILTEIAGAA